MVTKSRKQSSKKSARKAAKKTAEKTAQIELDPETVHQFESHLRQGLVASGAVLMSTEGPDLQPGATVHLDPDTAAHLAEILRNGLVSSGAVLASEFPETVQTAGKGRAKGRRKGYGGAPAKKRSSKKR
jgi:hypothetical protein